MGWNSGKVIRGHVYLKSIRTSKRESGTYQIGLGPYLSVVQLLCTNSDPSSLNLNVSPDGSMQIHSPPSAVERVCPHIRQSRPDSGLGVQVKVLTTFQVVSSSLGRGLGWWVLSGGPILPYRWSEKRSIAHSSVHNRDGSQEGVEVRVTVLEREKERERDRVCVRVCVCVCVVVCF